MWSEQQKQQLFSLTCIPNKRLSDLHAFLAKQGCCSGSSSWDTSPLPPTVSPPDCMSFLVQVRFTCLTEAGVILFTIHTYHEHVFYEDNILASLLAEVIITTLLFHLLHFCSWDLLLIETTILITTRPVSKVAHSTDLKPHTDPHMSTKKGALTYSGKVCRMQMKRKLNQQSTGCKPGPPGRLPVYTCLHSDCAAWSPWVPCVDVISS